MCPKSHVLKPFQSFSDITFTMINVCPAWHPTQSRKSWGFIMAFKEQNYFVPCLKFGYQNFSLWGADRAAELLAGQVHRCLTPEFIFPSPLVFGIIWTEQGGPADVKTEYILKPCHKTNKQTSQPSPRRSHEYLDQTRGSFLPLSDLVCPTETEPSRKAMGADRMDAAHLDAPGWQRAQQR